mmetsp:Transcript_59649/g.134387  ORF Transcript_59649/g.134387 Transcript_59649/m.134387 type:complete len:203 (-) Transcript_59649:326-934(-)
MEHGHTKKPKEEAAGDEHLPLRTAVAVLRRGALDAFLVRQDAADGEPDSLDGQEGQAQACHIVLALLRLLVPLVLVLVNNPVVALRDEGPDLVVTLVHDVQAQVADRNDERCERGAAIEQLLLDGPPRIDGREARHVGEEDSPAGHVELHLFHVGFLAPPEIVECTRSYGQCDLHTSEPTHQLPHVDHDLPQLAASLCKVGL